jgi:hypothetical protein
VKILIFKLLKKKNIKEFNNFNFWKKKLKKKNINQDINEFKYKDNCLTKNKNKIKINI